LSGIRKIFSPWEEAHPFRKFLVKSQISLLFLVFAFSLRNDRRSGECFAVLDKLKLMKYPLSKKMSVLFFRHPRGRALGLAFIALAVNPMCPSTKKKWNKPIWMNFDINIGYQTT
jgi:hypothetical protein